MDFISQFTTDIRYIKGQDNVVADYLSRFEVDGITEDALTPDVLAKLQKDDEESRYLLQSSTHGQNQLKFDRIKSLDDFVELVYEIGSGKAHCYIPRSVRRVVFKKVHDLAHPGVRATLRLVVARYFWPSVNSDVRDWTNKVSRHTRTAPGSFVLPTSRFDHVHIDLVGPLPECRGQKYLLTAVERFTRWPMAIPIL